MGPESLREIPLGQRVTVRYRLADGRASDSVGRITNHGPTTVTLQTRRGAVDVDLDTVLVHRIIQPVPWRIARFLRRAEVVALDLDTTRRHLDATAPLVHELTAAGTPVFLTARDRLPLPAQLDRSGSVVLHLPSGEAGEPPTPEAEVYAAAHAQIEEQLARTIGRGQVHFTDDNPRHVESARDCGWQGRVFTPPD